MEPQVKYYDRFETLDRMAEIVEREMLVTGIYASSVRDQALADSGAVCGGRAFCAMGSLWTGHGERKMHASGMGYVLHGVSEPERGLYFLDHPELEAAYEALNAEAQDFIERHPGVNYDGEYTSELEGLFEGAYERGVVGLNGVRDEDDQIGRDDLLAIIDGARERLRAALVS